MKKQTKVKIAAFAFSIIGIISLLGANYYITTKWNSYNPTPKPISPSTVPLTLAPEPVNLTEFETLYVGTDTLNCRATPDINGDIVHTYERGEALTIIGMDSTGEWLQTLENWWCNKEYLKESQEEANYIEEVSEVENDNSSSHSNYLGNFLITGYTSDLSENGGYSTTYTGVPLDSVIGSCIAVDTSVIPLGSSVYIEGLGTYTAMDIGGAIVGSHIDVLTGSNAESESITGNYDVYLN